MPNSSKHIVITVHGIRTFGGWQQRLEKITKAHNRDIIFFHFQYGYFSALAFLIPLTRGLLVRRFRDELTALAERVHPTRIDLVGHSFGTHLIAWSLQRLPTDNKIRIDTMILAGSVLRSDFYWPALIPIRVRRVINDCGAQDFILILSQIFVLFTGMAGRAGFVGMNGPEFQNRYSQFGHSGYFEDRSGRQTDQYMVEKWLPLILGDHPIEGFDERRPPSALSGVTVWLTNNLEPIKILSYVMPFILFSIYVSALYVQSRLANERIAAIFDLTHALERRGQIDPDTKRLVSTIQHAARLPLGFTEGIWINDGSDGVNSNYYEKNALKRFGFCFFPASNTEEGVAVLKRDKSRFKLVISDFKRLSDPKPGYVTLDEVKSIRADIPFIYYVLNFTDDQAREAQRRGAQFETNHPLELWEQVFRAGDSNNVPMGRLRFLLNYVKGCPYRSP